VSVNHDDVLSLLRYELEYLRYNEAIRKSRKKQAIVSNWVKLRVFEIPVGTRTVAQTVLVGLTRYLLWYLLL
jgi:hypothetical protein